MSYNFKIHVKPFKNTSPYLQEVRSIYVSGICIVAKNSKEGCFYYSKYAIKEQGNFHYVAGSIKYPALLPKTRVIIKVTNFPRKPNLQLHLPEYKDYISISDIQETDNIKSI